MKNIIRKTILGILIVSVLFFACSCSLFTSDDPSDDIDDSDDNSLSESDNIASDAESTASSFCLAFYPDEELNPFTCQNESNVNLMSLIFEGLVCIDTNFEPVPQLCNAYSVSEDGLIYTFRLRSNVKFSDGTNLTAEDVVSSINEARSYYSKYSSRLSDVSSVYIDSEGNVAILLTRANERFPALLDIPIAKVTDNNRYVGTGPYVSNITGIKNQLLRNPHWWQNSSLPFSSISLSTVSDVNDVLEQFNTQNISLINSDSTETYSTGYIGNCESWTLDTSQMLFIGFNATGNVFSHAIARQIINFAIDRQSIADNIFSGAAKTASLPISPSASLYDEDVAAQISYSPTALSELLIESGFSDAVTPGILSFQGEDHSFSFDVELIVNSESSYKVNAANQIASSLKDFGIHISVVELGWDDYLQALQNKDFDMYLGEVLLTNDFNLRELIGSTGSLNYGGYQSPECDTLLASGKYDSELYNYIIDDSPIVPILFKTKTILTHRNTISGFSATQNNTFFNISQWTLLD